MAQSHHIKVSRSAASALTELAEMEYRDTANQAHWLLEQWTARILAGEPLPDMGELPPAEVTVYIRSVPNALISAICHVGREYGWQVDDGRGWRKVTRYLLELATSEELRLKRAKPFSQAQPDVQQTIQGNFIVSYA